MAEKTWSPEEQKQLFRKLGLNPDRWDPHNNKIVAEFGKVAIAAQISGKDAQGGWLTNDDLELLHVITGRG